MVHCSIVGCKSRSERKEADVTFHKIPTDLVKRKEWMKRTGRLNWTKTHNVRICSKHFSSDSWRNTNKRKLLKSDVIPDINIHNYTTMDEPTGEVIEIQTDNDLNVPNVEQPAEVAMEMEIECYLNVPNVEQPAGVAIDIEIECDPNVPDVEHFTKMEMKKEIELDPNVPNVEQPAEVAMEMEIECYLNVPNVEQPAGVAIDIEIECDPNVPNVEDFTEMEMKKEIERDPVQPSSEDIMSPRKQKLVKELNKKSKLAERRKKKIAALRAKSWRLQKRTAELTNVVAELKARSMISQEAANELLTIDPINKDFLKKFLCKDISEHKYSAALRKFALTLHFISPKAYTFVRKQFNTCLPHPRTLSRWYQTIDANPGFSKESLRAVKLLNECQNKKNPSRELLCALCFDEMAIRKFVNWDGNDCVGFVDLGNNTSSEKLAKEALVFMLTCVNGSWKIPLGYFLINGISAEQKATLVKTAIELVYTECGVRTLSVTFDGCPTNFAMAKLLGCSIDFTKNIDPCFTVGDQKVVIFPDPAHMLKLVRNTLGDKRFLSDRQGRTISWDYVQELVDLQESEGLHLGNKLNKSHINFKKQIMKVKLAAQLFSESVADAIEYCAEENIGLFDDSEATVEFIRRFNHLFDIMNSRNLNAFPYKQPITKNNYDSYKLFLEDMFDYISNLQLQERNILLTARKTGFCGFMICIRSVLWLYEQYISSGNDLLFLSTYKLSQDHLEYFFSAIRAKGGFNNNPTAKQFQSAFKRLLIHGELKHITTGNTIPLQEINILTYSRPEIAINNTTPNSRMIDTDNIDFNTDKEDNNLIDDHQHLADPSRLTDYSKSVIVYIAGFVVGKLLNEIKCEECLSCLLSIEKYKSLQLKKDKGGLHYPSQDVVKIVEICEAVFRKKALSEKNLFHTLVQQCMKNCIGLNIFPDLTAHCRNQSIVDNHYSLLVKAISMKYLKVRLHYATKKISEKNEKVRNFFNKLILFNGQ